MSSLKQATTTTPPAPETSSQAQKRCIDQAKFRLYCSKFRPSAVVSANGANYAVPSHTTAIPNPDDRARTNGWHLVCALASLADQISQLKSKTELAEKYPFLSFDMFKKMAKPDASARDRPNRPDQSEGCVLFSTDPENAYEHMWATIEWYSECYNTPDADFTDSRFQTKVAYRRQPVQIDLYDTFEYVTQSGNNTYNRNISGVRMFHSLARAFDATADTPNTTPDLAPLMKLANEDLHLQREITYCLLDMFDYLHWSVGHLAPTAQVWIGNQYLNSNTVEDVYVDALAEDLPDLFKFYKVDILSIWARGQIKDVAKGTYSLLTSEIL